MVTWSVWQTSSRNKRKYLQSLRLTKYNLHVITLSVPPPPPLPLCLSVCVSRCITNFAHILNPRYKKLQISRAEINNNSEGGPTRTSHFCSTSFDRDLILAGPISDEMNGPWYSSQRDASMKVIGRTMGLCWPVTADHYSLTSCGPFTGVPIIRDGIITFTDKLYVSC